MIGSPFYVMERVQGDVIVRRDARTRWTVRSSASGSPSS